MVGNARLDRYPSARDILGNYKTAIRQRSDDSGCRRMGHKDPLVEDYMLLNVPQHWCGMSRLWDQLAENSNIVPYLVAIDAMACKAVAKTCNNAG